MKKKKGLTGVTVSQAAATGSSAGGATGAASRAGRRPRERSDSTLP